MRHRETHVQRAGNGHAHDHEPLSHMSSNELRREIEHTRDELEHTIDELKHVASPEELLRTVTNMMRGGPGRFLRNFGYTVRDNPLPMTLTAVGLIWLFANERREGGGREESWHGKGTARERVKEAGEKARDVGANIRDTLHQQAEENPLLLAALGVAIGAALGGAMPRTGIEDWTVGRVGERARKRVRQVVSERRGNVGSSMGRMVERAREAMESEGGSSDD